MKRFSKSYVVDYYQVGADRLLTLQALMNIIQDITSQTSSGSMATARSIGELNEMAAALQESVTGFKLSNDDEQLEQEFSEDEYLEIDESVSANM